MKLVHLLNVKHIGYKSHQFALAIRAILNSDNMVNYLDAVHERMKSVKYKLTNTAMLRNINDLKPVIQNDTK